MTVNLASTSQWTKKKTSVDPAIPLAVMMTTKSWDFMMVVALLLVIWRDAQLSTMNCRSSLWQFNRGARTSSRIVVFDGRKRCLPFLENNSLNNVWNWDQNPTKWNRRRLLPNIFHNKNTGSSMKFHTTRNAPRSPDCEWPSSILQWKDRTSQFSACVISDWKHWPFRLFVFAFSSCSTAAYGIPWTLKSILSFFFSSSATGSAVLRSSWKRITSAEILVLKDLYLSASFPSVEFLYGEMGREPVPFPLVSQFSQCRVSLHTFHLESIDHSSTIVYNLQEFCCICPWHCLWLQQRQKRPFQILVHDKRNASH